MPSLIHSGRVFSPRLPSANVLSPLIRPTTGYSGSRSGGRSDSGSSFDYDFDVLAGKYPVFAHMQRSAEYNRDLKRNMLLQEVMSGSSNPMEDIFKYRGQLAKIEDEYEREMIRANQYIKMAEDEKARYNKFVEDYQPDHLLYDKFGTLGMPLPIETEEGEQARAMTAGQLADFYSRNPDVTQEMPGYEDPDYEGFWDTYNQVLGRVQSDALELEDAALGESGVAQIGADSYNVVYLKRWHSETGGYETVSLNERQLREAQGTFMETIRGNQDMLRVYNIIKNSYLQNNPVTDKDRNRYTEIMNTHNKAVEGETLEADKMEDITDDEVALANWKFRNYFFSSTGNESIKNKTFLSERLKIQGKVDNSADKAAEQEFFNNTYLQMYLGTLPGYHSYINLNNEMTDGSIVLSDPKAQKIYQAQVQTLSAELQKLEKKYLERIKNGDTGFENLLKKIPDFVPYASNTFAEQYAKRMAIKEFLTTGDTELRTKIVKAFLTRNVNYIKPNFKTDVSQEVIDNVVRRKDVVQDEVSLLFQYMPEDENPEKFVDEYIKHREGKGKSLFSTSYWGGLWSGTLESVGLKPESDEEENSIITNVLSYVKTVYGGNDYETIIDPSTSLVYIDPDKYIERLMTENPSEANYYETVGIFKYPLSGYSNISEDYPFNGKPARDFNLIGFGGEAISKEKFEDAIIWEGNYVIHGIPNPHQNNRMQPLTQVGVLMTKQELKNIYFEVNNVRKSLWDWRAELGIYRPDIERWINDNTNDIRAQHLDLDKKWYYTQFLMESPWLIKKASEASTQTNLAETLHNLQENVKMR